MLSTLPEEGLSRPAKALLKLLKWAEKEELHKEPRQQNKPNRGWTHVTEEKDNTKRNKRESIGNIQPTANAERDC